MVGTLTLAACCAGQMLAAPAASADPSTGASAPTQSQINATEAQVATIEAQIGRQQQALAQADEAYDQAMVELNATQASLQTTTASLATTRQQLAADQARLREDALRAYMYGAASTTVARWFSPGGSTNETRQTYQQVIFGDVTQDAAQVRTTQRRLVATQTKLVDEQHAQSAEVAQQSQAQQAAAAATRQAQATLTQAQGTLAQQVAARAAQQAAQAAAAAAAAKTQAAAQAAAAQATKAATVAATLGAGGASAASAANSANQAATSASSKPSGGATGVTTGVTVGSGGAPSAAGRTAVQAAARYLGTPYVFGGGTSSGPSGSAVPPTPPAYLGHPGFDCSGLVMYAWAQAGVAMDHSAADQYARFPHVSMSSLEPGDLIFYDLDGSGIDHVVMYVSGNSVIQAPQTGQFVSYASIWQSGLVGAARP